MTRHTQQILYHLLPVVFWLLAIGGCAVPVVWSFFSSNSAIPIANYSWGFLVAALVMCCVAIIHRIPRQTETATQCFQMAVLLGIASYWMPTVLFLTIPIMVYLYLRHLFNSRSFMAFVLGYAFDAVWAAVFIFFDRIANPWAAFFAQEYAWGWIPTGAIILAWLASIWAHRVFRVW